MTSARALRPAAGIAAGIATALVLSACTGGPDAPAPAPAASTTASTTASAPAAGPVEEGYSTPVEDRVYPDVGDPSVDALHYRLDLDWDPESRTLDAVERLRLRATTDSDTLRLDLGEPLEVTDVRLDGAPAAYDHDGKDLVVTTPAALTAGSEHTLVVRYAGSPQPVPAPVQRGDFSETGWTTTADGEVWTMQEPYGAYSWYAVNDQPSDKALYDVTITAPAPMVGVSNGELLSRRTRDGQTVTRWRLSEPASSYLVTVAIGDLEMTTDRSADGVPITYWTPTDRPQLVRRLQRAPAGLAWLEERLGPYPFDSLGFLIVDSRSGMETQTMITLGDSRYATSPEVLVHEMAHHWYGDEVTPVDWRDVWMNEGMAMYLQAVWQDEHQDQPLADTLDYWTSIDEELRSTYGPPADFHPDAFGSTNVYTTPAVMWDELRRRLGDDTFWRLVRAWPAAHAGLNADYDDITAWWSAESGEDLGDVFDAWLLGDTTPARG